MTDKEAMNLALEALMYASYEDIEYNDACAAKVLEAITALKERLAQPEQEPDYKLLFGELAEKFALLLDEKKMWKKQALFCFDVTAPPQRTEQEPPNYSFKAHWEKDGRIGVVAAIVRPDGGIHLLQDIIDPPQPQEKPVMMEIFWDGEEAGVKLTQGFIDSHKVLQLDVLIDAKAEIERIYEELLGAKE
jgi:hypothetical protein